MDKIEGKNAFITGGASGIGFAIAQALSSAGARIVIADINEQAAAATANKLTAAGGEACSIALDVADIAQWSRAREIAIERLGKIHILCNNAGVTGSLRTPVDELKWVSWAWTRSINLEGVLNGIIAILPHMKEHGEAAHIVNTGSMASHLGLAGTGDYTAAKFGVAGLSEVLKSELAGSNIGISVLCPGYTDTGLIANSRLLMPAGEAARLDKLFGSANTTSNISSGLDPAIVGELVRKGIEDNRFYIFSDPGFRDEVAERYQGILEDFGWAKARLGEA